MRWSLILALAVMLLGAAPVEAQAPAPFAERTEETRAAPNPLQEVWRWALSTQQDLYRGLSRQIRHVREEGHWLAALPLFGAAFLYGVFHSVGPGHGKVVVASYFAARRSRLGHGVLMGGTIALTQALAATLLVTILGIVVGLPRGVLLGHTQTLELISYALITLLGGVMVWRSLRGQAACCFGEHEPTPTACGPSCSHDHHHDHDHHHHHHDHHPPPKPPEGRLARLDHPLFVGMAAGLRPCAGAILVLLFALANGIYGVGIAATLAMAFGVFLTITALGTGTILLRRLTEAGAGRLPRVSPLLTRTLSIGGGVLVMVFGVVFFFGTWGRDLAF